jgi:flagellar protein FliO/FliZ
MTQSLITVIVFVGLMLSIPFILRRVQQRRGMLPAGAPGVATRVMSTVSVGPQQRVVTLEVGPEQARTWLVLGVTGQSITCLHAAPAGREALDV